MKKTIFLLSALFLMMTSPGTGMGQVFRGNGDFEFFLDAGSLPLRDGKVLELFQVAVPTREIQYKETNGSYTAAVSVYILLESQEGKVHEKRLVIRDTRAQAPVAQDLAGFIYIADSCSVAPGDYTLSARLEDLNRGKKTLLGMLRKKHYYSALEGQRLEVPVFEADRLAVGGPFLLWGKGAGGQYIPNPMGIYGLKNDTLSFFIHAMVPENIEVDSVGVFAAVVGGNGERIDSLELDCAVSGGSASVFGAFDVNAWPAGSYNLAVELFGEGIHGISGKDFSVAWEIMNWIRPQRDIMLEARLIFTDPEYDDFREASLGQQEKIMNLYWEENDPTPHTAVNESYETFMQRVNYANANFGGFRKGAVTDRGQIFIRFGFPEEIMSESVPVNRTDLNEAIDKIEDQYKVVVHNTMKGLGTEEVQMYDLLNNRSRPYRGGGMDAGGYEIWIYTIKGKPLFKRDQLMTIDSGLRFLFVDKDGVGNYVLVGTSEDFDKQHEESSGE